LAYTVLFDPTTLTTEGGARFEEVGVTQGDEIVDDHLHVLEDTGVTGYPF